MRPLFLELYESTTQETPLKLKTNILNTKNAKTTHDIIDIILVIKISPFDKPERNKYIHPKINKEDKNIITI